MKTGVAKDNQCFLLYLLGREECHREKSHDEALNSDSSKQKRIHMQLFIIK